MIILEPFAVIALIPRLPFDAAADHVPFHHREITPVEQRLTGFPRHRMATTAFARLPVKLEAILVMRDVKHGVVRGGVAAIAW